MLIKLKVINILIIEVKSLQIIEFYIKRHISTPVHQGRPFIREGVKTKCTNSVFA